MTRTPFDKLAHIAALRPSRAEPAPIPNTAREERHQRLALALGAELRKTPHGQHLAVMGRFAISGAFAIGPRARRLLAPRSRDEIADSSRWLLLDTETTGLSGGTGTYAFLVGIAWWEAEELVVEQLFMRDHSEEASLLLDLSRRLAERPVLVTFNGKSFDWPLLETRYRLTRAASIASPVAHLDLLHPARQLWRFRLKSVALAELERHVLQIDRGVDIPSHTIPQRYFDFLRGGTHEPIVEIFRHNQMDLCGLAALAARITALLEEPQPNGVDAAELFGVSRMLHRQGEESLAEEGYQRALSHGLPEPADRAARRELAFFAKRHGNFARANELWASLIGDSKDGILALEQLAIHYEHRERNPKRALDLVREALARLRESYLAGRIDPHRYRSWHDAFRHRLDRLQKLAE